MSFIPDFGVMHAEAEAGFGGPIVRHQSYDVIVVGLGPVGAATAHLLAKEGLRVLAVEQSLEPCDKPRAIGIDHEALRLLQELQVTDAFSPHIGQYRPSEYLSASGEVLRRIVPQPEPHPLSWPPYNTFVQPDLERILRAGFARWPTLETTLGTRCVAVEQGTDTVVLTLEDVESGNRRLASALYVVGCDGAWSPIREASGIELEDLQFDESWLVLDVRVHDDAQLPNATVQYCDPSRPCTFIAGPGNLRRWEIMLLPGEIPSEMTRDEVIWSLLSPWLTRAQGEIWRAATYRFHALVARQWRRGRVFIAGDAAHQTPPFMAQGLNQGFRDAANLCWKIVEVLKHGANASLLDSYDLERRPNARAVIELTKTFGRLICERDPVAAAERDRVLLSEMRAGRGEIVRQDLLPPISSGFLLQDESGSYAPGTGSTFPQPWIRTNGGKMRMDDLVHGRFLMVVREGWVPTPIARDIAKRVNVTFICATKDAAAEGVLPLSEDVALIAAWLDRHGLFAVLVRPDHIVFGSTNKPGGETDLLAALDDALRDPSKFWAAQSPIERWPSRASSPS